ncbi:LPS export ABC transporter permease LptF [Undibacterium curvum]|uniref:Lipopolysaccharide export system permease protein LptF n=1 Tax=Undibacterium curvum TaxID=2762294 RepID=A0ABR7A3N0_9BURK|nr:LPS export ABC transporter permease LptF [Undibacterium curvum]MBC3931447.1 LPS export ABC transporter permease LptF [Undibacterium curvum]
MIFQRALRRELLSAAGAVLATLFVITVTWMLIRVLEQAAGGRVASADVLALIGFMSLMYLPILLILTGFIAVLLVVTRSYQESEMVVWFASGLSLTQWISPVIKFGFPIVALTAFLSFFASPWANRQSVEFEERFQKRSDIAKVSPGKFQESSASDRIFFVEEVAGDLSKVQNIFINTVKDGRSSVVVAKEGKIEIDKYGDKFLVMDRGRRYDGLPTAPDFQMMQFERYGVLVSSQSNALNSDNSAKSMPLSELLIQPDPHKQAELLWRISLPVMAAVLMLLAIPLGFVNPRVGRSANLIVALLATVFYLTMVNISQSLVLQGRAAFALGWWPVHASVAVLVWLLFVWRLKINSRWHPAGIWSRCKSGATRKASAA